jgi:hypothetical protein
MPRGQFFFYWNTFQRYGLLGVIDKAREAFRSSKIGLANEAQLVVDKLQRPDRPDSFYVDRLKSKGVRVNRSTVAKIFGKWNVKAYHCEFVDDLKRLSASGEETETVDLLKDPKPLRLVDQNFLVKLRGLSRGGLPVDAPGLFVLWYYLEELQFLPILQAMGLTGETDRRGYSWFDHLLLDVARRFYGQTFPGCFENHF